MESKWLSVLVAGASVAFLSGCGPSDGLPTASGKLTQDDANKTLQSIRLNGGLGSFDPSNLLVPNKGESGGRTSKFVGFESLAKRSNKEVSSPDGHIKGDEKKWTEDCRYYDYNNDSFKYGGTETVTVISGKPYFYFDTKAKTMRRNYDENGSASIKVERNKCINWHGVKETGTITRTVKWSGHHKHNETHEATTEYTSGYTYQYGDNKWEISSGSSSLSYEGNASKVSYNFESKFSGTLTIDGKKTTYKNFDVKSGDEKTHTDKSYSSKRTSSISGAFKSDATDGWIVIKTPTEFEYDSNKTVSNCLKEGGKLTIEGSEHKLTASALKDHSLEIKYDDKVIERYKDCVENSEEQ